LVLRHGMDPHTRCRRPTVLTARAQGRPAAGARPAVAAHAKCFKFCGAPLHGQAHGGGIGDAPVRGEARENCERAAPPARAPQRRLLPRTAAREGEGSALVEFVCISARSSTN